MSHEVCHFRASAAPHQTHQTVKVETARQPTPFLLNILQATKQKAASTKRLLDHRERTLTRMTTPRINFLSSIGRHLPGMSGPNFFVRFAAQRALFGLASHAHHEQRTALAIGVGGFEPATFDFRSTSTRGPSF